MNEHESMNELLPSYAAGTLDGALQSALSMHLQTCEICRDDLAVWERINMEIQEGDRKIKRPERIVRYIRQITREGGEEETPGSRVLISAWVLLQSQIPLVRREIWPASSAILLIGLAAAVIAQKTLALYALGPLIAAACMALLYGEENDACHELALSTPTSPRRIMLARLLLVFGFNLTAFSLVSAAAWMLIETQSFWPVLFSWLAPMTFLSGLSLLLSIWIGSAHAIGVSYGAWLAHLYLQGVGSSTEVNPVFFTRILQTYNSIWKTPLLLFALALVFSLTAVWLAGRSRVELIKSI